MKANGIGKEAIKERRKLKLKIFFKNKMAVVGLILTVIVVFSEYLQILYVLMVHMKWILPKDI